ncbi:hypothetical protein N0V83_010035 [Neocucurbitaria cava]|uniref:Uncharacterized protein n=1 Tax=Neocucurbitaria cava TaxID=798079 RepID=A0A9W8XYV8_9PLEO|nr:hypothetical protein N0V83_010035 [Neocucurbitaria cava]
MSDSEWSLTSPSASEASKASDHDAPDSADGLLESISVHAGSPAPTKTMAKKEWTASSAEKEEEASEKMMAARLKAKDKPPAKDKVVTKQPEIVEGRRKLSRQIERDPRDDGFGRGGARVTQSSHIQNEVRDDGFGAKVSKEKAMKKKHAEEEGKIKGVEVGDKVAPKKGKDIVDKVVPTKKTRTKTKGSVEKEKNEVTSRTEVEKRQSSKAPETFSPFDHGTGEENEEPVSTRVREGRKDARNTKAANEGGGKITVTKRSVATQEAERGARASERVNRPPAEPRPVRVTRSTSGAPKHRSDQNPIVPRRHPQASQAVHTRTTLKGNGGDGHMLPRSSQGSGKQRETTAHVDDEMRTNLHPQRQNSLSENSGQQDTVDLSNHADDTEDKRTVTEESIKQSTGSVKFLDPKSKDMLDQILKLASNSLEWSGFISLEDYSPDQGKALIREFGHSSTGQMLIYILGKISDSTTKTYKHTCFDYETIYVRVGDEAKRYRPNEIWKGYTLLVNGKRELDQKTEKEKARWYKSVWKKIVSRTPYFLDGRGDTIHDPRYLSYVLLLVFTLASPQALELHIQRKGTLPTEYTVWYEDGVSHLLKHLRKDIYPNLPTWKVTEIFHRLSAKIQADQVLYDMDTESDSDSDSKPNTTDGDTEGQRDTVTETQNTADSAESDGGSVASKRKSSRTHDAREHAAKRPRVDLNG